MPHAQRARTYGGAEEIGPPLFLRGRLLVVERHTLTVHDQTTIVCVQECGGRIHIFKLHKGKPIPTHMQWLRYNRQAPSCMPPHRNVLAREAAVLVAQHAHRGGAAVWAQRLP